MELDAIEFVAIFVTAVFNLIFPAVTGYFTKV